MVQDAAAHDFQAYTCIIIFSRALIISASTQIDCSVNHQTQIISKVIALLQNILQDTQNDVKLELSQKRFVRSEELSPSTTAGVAGGSKL